MNALDFEFAYKHSDALHNLLRPLPATRHLCLNKPQIHGLWADTTTLHCKGRR